jgi:hypothetical protein
LKQVALFCSHNPWRPQASERHVLTAKIDLAISFLAAAFPSGGFSLFASIDAGCGESMIGDALR